MSLQKWTLQSQQDISPSSWFPLEKRDYLLPNGQLVSDFLITTLADSVHIISVTTDHKVVLIKMYKPGVDEIMIQFPAGRYEKKHTNEIDAAAKELEEETGIKVTESELQPLGQLALMSTKATERAHYFLVTDVTFNSAQHLDDTEEIEVLTVTPAEIETMIATGEIWDAPCIAGWTLAKKKFPQLFS